MILPWDAAGIEERARRADLEMLGRAATPYARAADSVRGRLLSSSLAASPTRGAAGTREAMLAAAPELGRLATAGADATNAARATVAQNMYERDRARAESGAQFFGGMLNAGGSVLGTLTSALGGGGGARPGAAPAGGGNPLGGLLGAAAPIAGAAIGGPAGGMLGGTLGSALGGAMSPPAAPAPAPFNPMANPGAMAASPLSTPFAHRPYSTTATPPGAMPTPVAAGPMTAAPRSGVPNPAPPPVPASGPMSDADWLAADEEARRLFGRLGVR